MKILENGDRVFESLEEIERNFGCSANREKFYGHGECFMSREEYIEFEKEQEKKKKQEEAEKKDKNN